MTYPKSIQNLIGSYKKLPGIGDKTAERLALATLDLDEESVALFAKSLQDVKSKIKRCKECNNFSEDDLCDICKDKSRDQTTICVVEDPQNVILFEKMGTYNGLYHVLDGLISPLDGINPEDIHIDQLVKRIEKKKIKEVIIAVKPSVEGETTSLYLLKKLEGLEVMVTKIASGVPLGADMEYIDALTLELALEDRRKISN